VDSIVQKWGQVRHEVVVGHFICQHQAYMMGFIGLSGFMVSMAWRLRLVLVWIPTYSFHGPWLSFLQVDVVGQSVMWMDREGPEWTD